MVRLIGWFIFLAFTILVIKVLALPSNTEEVPPKISLNALSKAPTTYENQVIRVQAHVCSCDFFMFRSITFVAQDSAQCQENRVALLSNKTHDDGEEIEFTAKLVIFTYSSRIGSLYLLKETQ
ncbi:MAG: hypothetical protein HC892_02490 [Saprospiraceae bacterium]|nr:hypothetical protein [Saprospiraceae bacterium]